MFISICIESFTTILSKILNNKKIRIISHGVSQNSQNKKKYNLKKIIKLLYVSTIKQYKHQWNLVEAVAKLKKRGL